MDTEIKAWASLTYALIKSNKIVEAVEYLRKEYNGSILEISYVLSKLFAKMAKEK
jgi:hypothetical protein